MDHYVPLVLAQYDGPPRNDRPGGAGVVPEPSSIVLGLCAVLAFAAHAGYKLARGRPPAEG